MCLTSACVRVCVCVYVSVCCHHRTNHLPESSSRSSLVSCVSPTVTTTRSTRTTAGCTRQRIHTARSRACKRFDATLSLCPIDESNNVIILICCILCCTSSQAVFDIFVLAHFVGSLVKMLILRDWKVRRLFRTYPCNDSIKHCVVRLQVTWGLLIVWEILEYSCQHLLPNFAECWWDHWGIGESVATKLVLLRSPHCRILLLADVFGFNLAGIIVGMWLCQKMSSEPSCCNSAAHFALKLVLSLHRLRSVAVRLDWIRQPVSVTEARTAAIYPV